MFGICFGSERIAARADSISGRRPHQGDEDCQGPEKRVPDQQLDDGSLR